MRENQSELEKMFFCRALLQLSFLAIPANFVLIALKLEKQPETA